MDHLPYPKEPCAEHLKIPYLCGSLIDLQGSETAPDAFGAGNLSEEEKEYFRDLQLGPARVQSTIYFGLLRNLYTAWDVPFEVDDFLIRDENGKFISLKCLESTIQSASRRASDYLFALQFSRDKNQDLVKAAGVARAIIPLSPLFQLIGLSLEILVWTVVTHQSRSSRPKFLKFQFDRGIPGDFDILQQRMFEAGWCPYWVDYYSRKHSVALLYYLGAMTAKPHSRCTREDCKGPADAVQDVEVAQKVRHVSDSCKCSLHDADTAKIVDIVRRRNIPLLKLKKRSIWSSKSMVGGLASWLNRTTPFALNTIPGIPAPDAWELDVEIVEADPDTSFVAISHVWADGLGNEERNALPRCQLEFLFQCATSLAPDFSKHDPYADQSAEDGLQSLLRAARSSWLKKMPRQIDQSSGDVLDLEWSSFAGKPKRSFPGDAVYVWIDTICVPRIKKKASTDTVDDEGAKLPPSIDQKTAIDMMARIYSQASGVLVLDRSLLGMTCRPTEALSIASRMMTSPWMMRCWTFQEGCLAKRLSFQLAESSISVKKILRHFDEFFQANRYERALIHDCISEIIHLPKVFPLADPPLDRWIYIWRRVFSQTGSEDWENKSDIEFSRIWNELVQRRTKQREDLHAILANMLCLSAKEILDLPPEQRTKGILRAVGEVPFEFFYYAGQDVEKVPGSPWVPLYPKITLNTKSVMRFDIVDCLNFTIGCDDDTGPSSWEIEEEIELHKTPTFKIYDTVTNKVAIQTIECVLPSDKPLQQFPSGKNKFLVCINRSGYRNGALFIVINEPGDRPTEVEYICPLRVPNYETIKLDHDGLRQLVDVAPPFFLATFVKDKKFRLNIDGEGWVRPSYVRPPVSSSQLVPSVLLYIWLIRYPVSITLTIYMLVHRSQVTAAINIIINAMFGVDLTSRPGLQLAIFVTYLIYSFSWRNQNIEEENGRIDELERKLRWHRYSRSFDRDSEVAGILQERDIIIQSDRECEEMDSVPREPVPPLRFDSRIPDFVVPSRTTMEAALKAAAVVMALTSVLWAAFPGAGSIILRLSIWYFATNPVALLVEKLLHQSRFAEFALNDIVQDRLIVALLYLSTPFIFLGYEAVTDVISIFGWFDLVETVLLFLFEVWWHYPPSLVRSRKYYDRFEADPYWFLELKLRVQEALGWYWLPFTLFSPVVVPGTLPKGPPQPLRPLSEW